MNYPIVNVATKDKLNLYGLLLETPGSDSLLINFHGTASNFYEEDFIEVIAKTLRTQRVSVLSANNRGAYVLEAYQPSGAATEFFEDCVTDIDAWIRFALFKGYKNIILQGHSLGTEKAVYYMSKGKYRSKVKAVILLAFSDSYGTHFKYVREKARNLMSEAKNLVRKRKGYVFLTSYWWSHAGALPKSAASYLNFFEENSELSKALPLRTGKLELYGKIKVPILAVIGDKKEFTVIPIKRALALLKNENKLTEAHQIKNCNHDFEGREKELAQIISDFTKREIA